MPLIHPIQLLLGVFIGLALGLAVPELWRSCHHAADSRPAGAQDDALMGLLLLAAFALGAFTVWIIRDLF